MLVENLHPRLLGLHVLLRTASAAFGIQGSNVGEFRDQGIEGWGRRGLGFRGFKGIGIKAVRLRDLGFEAPASGLPGSQATSGSPLNTQPGSLSALRALACLSEFCLGAQDP